MILEHFAEGHVRLDRGRTYRQMERRGDKPEGLWVSVPGPDDWPTWCINNEFSISALLYRHRVWLNEGANILHLATAAEVQRFGETMRSPADPRTQSSGLPRIYSIQWDLVASFYDGIVIAPWQGEIPWSGRPWHGGHTWYSSWDVASGCIWNLDAIDSMGLVDVQVPWTVRERYTPSDRYPSFAGESGPESLEGR